MDPSALAQQRVQDANEALIEARSRLGNATEYLAVAEADLLAFRRAQPDNFGDPYTALSAAVKERELVVDKRELTSRTESWLSRTESWLSRKEQQKSRTESWLLKKLITTRQMVK